MNIEYFQEGLDSLMYCGQKLTPEQIVLIENSLIMLQHDNRFCGVFFWGRINAIEVDYYIAYGYTTDCLRTRKMYYSTDCYQWQLLPFVDSSDVFQASLVCQECFTGDPTTVTLVKLDPPFECNAEPKDVVTTDEDNVYLKEEDRLAAIVFIINEECGITPRGGLYKMTDDRVVPNPVFRGLTDLQVDNISYYQLYRWPRKPLKENLTKRSDYNFPVDFLDSIDDVLPACRAFSLSMQRDERLVIIRSLIWPGMTFFHKLESRKHGYCYFGDGKKNFDMLFMI